MSEVPGSEKVKNPFLTKVTDEKETKYPPYLLTGRDLEARTWRI